MRRIDGTNPREIECRNLQIFMLLQNSGNKQETAGETREERIIELVEVTEVATKSRGILFTAPFPATPMAVTAAGTDQTIRHG